MNKTYAYFFKYGEEKINGLMNINEQIIHGVKTGVSFWSKVY
jgi:hypothetical protein